VYALAPQGGGVNIGGLFTLACSTNISGCLTVNNVAYWDGATTYAPFSDGVFTGTNALVHALLPDGAGGMYIGGDFTVPEMYLAHYNGVNFLNVGSSSLTGFVYTLAMDSQYLYAGGQFLNAGGSGANKIARLSLSLVGGDWQPLGASLVGGWVYSLAFSGKDLIAAGRFTQSGLTGLSNIARWDTTAQTWSPIGSGASDDVYGLASTANEIYASGLFTQMGGKESEYFARWASFHLHLPVVRK
jgi:hypothetical protein